MVVCGKSSSLPQETCAVVRAIGLNRLQGRLTAVIGVRRGHSISVKLRRSKRNGEASRSWILTVMTRQTSSERTFPLAAEVKPWGSKGMADSLVARQQTESPMFGQQLMEEVCERSNLHLALKRVRQNAGAPGVDGMSVSDLREHLKKNWPAIKQQLLEGSYQPRAIRRVRIPKPTGKDKRGLGIPCVLDRFIQQALLQVLQGKWDKRFSDHSYGFRPGRRAHQAVAQAHDPFL